MISPILQIKKLRHEWLPKMPGWDNINQHFIRVYQACAHKISLPQSYEAELFTLSPRAVQQGKWGSQGLLESMLPVLTIIPQAPTLSSRC